jgi:peptidoglycan/LPS O-acetylase OafA/YrhL
MRTIPARNQTLDIVRAILAWAVVSVHCVWLADLGGDAQRVFGAVGVWSVIGFVTLSGYVITQALLRRKEPYRAFITRRFCRLFPAFALCLTLALIVRAYCVGQISSEAGREASETEFYWVHLGAHLSLLHGLIPDTLLPATSMAFLPPAWSVSLEWQLYLVAPFAVRAMVNFGKGAGIALLALSLAMIVSPLSGYISHYWTAMGAFLPQRFFFFALGMFLAIYPLRLPKPKVRWPARLVYCGQISYSTYLVHWPLLVLLHWSLRDSGCPDGIHMAVALFVLGAPAIWIASSTIYDAAERPGIAVGNWLLRKKERTPLVQIQP